MQDLIAKQRRSQAQKKQITDWQGIAAEVYNNKDRTVILESIHPQRHIHPIEWFRYRIEPGKFQHIPHLRYKAHFEDGSHAKELTVNFGDARGKGITSPSLYHHPDHKRR